MVEKYDFMENKCVGLVITLLISLVISVVIFGADNSSSSHTDNQKRFSSR